ncbi:MAG: hypothetical protein AB7O97_00125 [Planctomycetota bacterium]
MRSLLLLLPLLAACSSLSSEDAQQLAAYQRRAGIYFEGGKYDQALGQVQRGLELDADDYKLRSIRAAILLRTSGPAGGREHPRLDASLDEFAEVFAQRSPSRHDRHVLFYYALAREKQGMRKLSEAARVDRTQPDADELTATATAASEAAFEGAVELLSVLLERGEIPRLCHFHLLQIAAARGDSAGILAHGDAYLTAAAAEQERVELELDQTTVYGYEQDRKRSLEALRQQEVAVRTMMAQQLYQKGDYAAALPHVDAVLRIDPSRSDDHYNRGLILLELGRIDAAKADMRTFLATTSLPPDSPKVVDAVQALTRSGR